MFLRLHVKSKSQIELYFSRSPLILGQNGNPLLVRQQSLYISHKSSDNVLYQFLLAFDGYKVEVALSLSFQSSSRSFGHSSHNTIRKIVDDDSELEAHTDS